MTFLLDTDVLGELRKRSGVADRAVLSWAAERSVHELWISTVTVLEIELGVLRVERRDPVQGAVLRTWLERSVLPGFDGRILDIDVPVAIRAARLHVPNPRPERDALIAASAAVHDCTLVTRNTSDFENCGLRVVNPWHNPADPPTSGRATSDA